MSVVEEGLDEAEVEEEGSWRAVRRTLLARRRSIIPWESVVGCGRERVATVASRRDVASTQREGDGSEARFERIVLEREGREGRGWSWDVSIPLPVEDQRTPGVSSIRGGAEDLDEMIFCKRISSPSPSMKDNALIST